MRSGLFVAPFVAAAYATTTSYGTTLVPELSGSVTITSTYRYSNPATAYLTETNSAGVVTGRPGVSGDATNQPQAVTSQPPVATIPAGLPTGYFTQYINISNSLTSFTVSVGKSSTTVLGDADISTVAGSSSVAAGGPVHPGRPTGAATGGEASSASASASSTETGAAGNLKVASAGMIGLGAMFAALL